MAPPKTTQPDPSTFIAYSHAAAGHDGVRSDPTGAILVKPCTRAEVAFYESAADHPAFQTFMPTFMGTLSLNDDHQEPSIATISAPAISDGVVQKADAADWVPSGGKELQTGLSIVLENVTAGFKRPNVIDLKLGARLWDEHAPEGKRRRLDDVSNATTSGSLGFRIAGMKVHRPEGKPDTGVRFAEYIKEEDDGYLSYDKYYGRGFDAENVREAFVEFFGGDQTLKESGQTRQAVKRLAGEVRHLAAVLEEIESRMYSASILMVYEGDKEAMERALEEEEQAAASKLASSENEDDQDEDNDEDDDDDVEKPKISTMRLIDFAHAAWTPGQGPDENVLQGVGSVLKILERLGRENDV